MTDSTKVDDGNPINAGSVAKKFDFDRKRFFTGYKEEFDKLSQEQVNGLESLLAWFEQDQEIELIEHIAYMLATTKHETEDRYQPIGENGGRSYYNRLYDPVLGDTAIHREKAKRHGNTAQGDGYKYRGRGFAQLTWKVNYKKLGDLLGYDLVSNPDKALEPSIAYSVMSYGMRLGLFTGYKLSDYIFEDRADYRKARRIVNSLDKADKIKYYAESFEHILKNSSVMHQGVHITAFASSVHRALASSVHRAAVALSENQLDNQLDPEEQLLNSVQELLDSVEAGEWHSATNLPEAIRQIKMLRSSDIDSNGGNS